LFYHLILTDRCNLCCSYCRGKVFDAEEDYGIDVEIDESLPLDFDSGIEDLCEFLKNDPDAVLTFYGGEPLMRMDLVREIMDKAPVGKFMIQTNGMLLHRLEPEYVNRFDTILISIDGPRELTDLHRGAGVFDRIVQTLNKIRAEGFKGEIIARMTVVENTDIYSAVKYLSSNPYFSFSSVHWQIDADFSNDYRKRNFGTWVRESYNPGIRRLISEWQGIMENEGRVVRWYPFLDTMQDLLTGRKSRLRCGSGYINYSIMTDGHIAPCPVMVGMKKYSLRSINLPGIGTKYELETEKKDTVAVFFLKNGNIQMYTLQHDCRTPSVAELSAVEARRLGTILTGAIMEADKESVEIAFSALSDLRISVHTYIIGKKMGGHSLEDLQIRAKTGVTIIAVSRGDKNVINPPPSFLFQEGDAVVAIGETDQLKTFEREIMVA